MTIEERIERNRKIAQFIMKAAMPLGLWFVAEYAVTVWSTHHMTLSVVNGAMSLGTPLMLFYILYQLRKVYFADTTFSRFRGWYFGVQLMFFAGMIEAVCVAIYNQWIAPGNLAEMHKALLEQYEQAATMLQNNALINKSLPSLAQALDQTHEQITNAPIGTPFDTAINLLSSDVMSGIMLSLPICFILHRKVEGEQQTLAKNEKK